MINKSKTIVGTFAIALLLGIAPCQNAFADHKNEQRNIAQVATEAGTFKTLLAALKATGLDKAVVGEGPFTVFAPSDDAFARLPEGTVETLLKKENLPKLARILKYHVASGRLDAKTLASKSKQKTLIDQTLTIRANDSGVLVNGSKVTTADIQAANGIIHVIDTVMIPGDPEEKTAKYDACQELVTMAIDRGVPLYNHGKPDACAAVYEMTAHSLLKMSRADLPRGAHHALQAGLKKMKTTHCADTQAWTMRKTLDQVMKMARR